MAQAHTARPPVSSVVITLAERIRPSRAYLPTIATAPVRPKIAIRRTSTNCVQYLRAKGYTVPQNPRIAAKTLTVKSKKLPPEGKVVVVVTYDGPLGHVSAAKVVNGELITVADSAFKAGRVIPQSVYKGYL